MQRLSNETDFCRRTNGKKIKDPGSLTPDKARMSVCYDDTRRALLSLPPGCVCVSRACSNPKQLEMEIESMQLDLIDEVCHGNNTDCRCVCALRDVEK